MRASSVAFSFGLVILPAVLGGCKDDQLKGAQAEVQAHKLKVTMPAVPQFEVPKVNGDGSHTVKEMRVQGERHLRETITVKGYVVYAYDCPTAIRLTGEADEALAKRIEEDPTLCQRPNLYLSDTSDGAVARGLWVVGIPRLNTKKELKNLPEEQLTKPEMVPPYKVGDEVSIVGTWQTSTDKGESYTEGLLVYQSMNNITQNWVSPAPLEAPAGTIAPPPH